MLTSAITSLDPALLRQDDTQSLRDGLERVSVPILVLDWDAKRTDFSICTANSAFETQSGHALAGLDGRALADILPDDQAVLLRYRLRKCLGTGAVLTCPEMITLPAATMVCEATYIPVQAGPDGRRVLWTWVALDRVEQRQNTKSAFEDLRFYSADAARQIAQVTTALEAIASSPPTQQRLQPAAQTLAAICRSAEQSLGRISDRSEGLMGMAEAPATYLTEARRLRDRDGYLAAMRDVVDDLIRLVAPEAEHQVRNARGTPMR